MVSFSPEFLNDLRGRLDSEQIVGEYVKLERTGNGFKGKCPFHEEKTPSFHVYTAQGAYHCFGCGAHGSMIDFVMEKKNLRFPEAVTLLAQNVGMEIPKDPWTRSSQGDRSRYKPLFDAMQRANELYRDALNEDTDAREYLQSRGLEASAMQSYQIGYAPKQWDFLKTKLAKTDEKVLIDCGLLIKNEDGHTYDRFRDRIIFPMRDRQGRVIAFGGRVLRADDEAPKYINSPQSPIYSKGRELYGLYEARIANRTLDKIVVVEGYMDVVTLAQHGFTFAVAPLGTALTQDQFQLQTRNTSEVIFCFDGDEAGKQAAWRALEIAFSGLKQGLRIRMLLLPDGHDPDSYIRQEGREKFTELLENARLSSDYFFDELCDNVDLQIVEAKVRLVERALPLIQLIPYRTYQHAMLRRLSDISGISMDKLESNYPSKSSQDRSSNEKPKRTAQSGKSLSNGDKNLLRILFHDIGIVNTISQKTLKSVIKFQERSVAFDVVARIKANNLRNVSEVLGSYRGSEVHSILSGLADQPPPGIRPETHLGKGFDGGLQTLIEKFERQDRQKRIPSENSKKAVAEFKKNYAG